MGLYYKDWKRGKAVYYLPLMNEIEADFEHIPDAGLEHFFINIDELDPDAINKIGGLDNTIQSLVHYQISATTHCDAKS